MIRENERRLIGKLLIVFSNFIIISLYIYIYIYNFYGNFSILSRFL